MRPVCRPEHCLFQQTLVDDLEDASNELMLVDEDEVRLAWECMSTPVLLRLSC